MISRERVLAALSHRQPDRVAVDFSAHRSSGIAAITYAKLRKHLGLREKAIRVYDPIQQLAEVDEDILDLFGVDTIELGRAFAREDDSWAEWILPDGAPCKMPLWAVPERKGNEWILRSKSGRAIGRMPPGALYFEQSYYPFAENADLDAVPEAMQESLWTAVASPPGPLTSGKNGREKFRQGARRLRQHTDRAIIALFGGNLIELGQFLFRHDNFLMMLAAEPHKAHSFLDKVLEIHLENLTRFMEDVGKFVDIVAFGDDLGTQNGPQIAPAMYREFFKERHAEMWRLAKSMAEVKVMLHSCGSLRELLPDLIEAGLDAINPVQTTSAGMDAAELKREFGSEITFWGGGCDTRDILPKAAPEEVKKHVTRQLEILSPGGGFVFQQVHNILADVPPQNVAAMFEAVKNWK